MTIPRAGFRIIQNCDGVSKVFPIAIQAYAATDITVMLTAAAGGSTVLTLNSDYSMMPTGSLEPPQWTLTTSSFNPYAAGYTLTAFINPAQEQQTEYVQGQAFPSLAVETNYDRLTQMIQRLQDQIFRSPHTPDGDINPQMTLPAADQRALTNLGFDSAGNLALFTVLAAGVLSRSSVGALLNPVISAETAIGAIIVDKGFPVDPWIDPRRYGADQTGVADSTAAVQMAMNVAQAVKGLLWFANGCAFSVGALSLVMTGNQTNDGLVIRGSAVNGSKLIQRGAPGAILTISGQTPTGAPQVSPVTLENFTIVCTGKTTDGIVLNGLAEWICRRLYISGTNRGIFLNSSLIGQVTQCTIFSNHYGVLARQDGAGSGTNLVTIAENRFYGNDIWGVDWGSGDKLSYENNDTSQNGSTTNFSFNGTLSTGATSGTLGAVWGLPTAKYPVYLSDGNPTPTYQLRAVLLTNGQTTATWTKPLTGGVVAAARACTGALVMRSTVNVNTGLANLNISGGWMEANLGQTLFVEATTQSMLTIANHNFYTDLLGQCMFVESLQQMSVKGSMAAGTLQTWDITASTLVLETVNVTTLTDTGVTYPTYNEVITSTITHTNGRLDNFKGILTGCSDSVAPNANVVVEQQGQKIELSFLGLISGTSNSNACTLTGLPPRYWPQADSIGELMVTDGTTVLTMPCQVLAVSGVINIGVGHTFSTGSTKAINGGSLRFRRT